MTSVESRLTIDTAQSDDGVEIVRPQGELDVATAPSLLEVLQAIIARGLNDIVLDASKLDFVDSTGISLLVTIHKRAEVEGRKLFIRSPGPQLSRLLELTALSSFFHLV